MRRIIQLLAVLCAAFFSVLAFAETANYLGTFKTDPQARAAMPHWANGASIATCAPVVLQGVNCWKAYTGTITGGSAIYEYAGYYQTGVCKADEDTDPATGQCRPKCGADEVRNVTTGVCEDKCKSKENLDQGSFTISKDPSGGFCYEGCAVAVSGTPTANADGSKTYPSSIGLGRSCVVGEASPSGDPYADPTAPPPPADGGGGGDGTCANGGIDYPTCTPPTGTCANGGTDYPTCTAPGSGTCTNGGTDYPTCTAPGSGTCTNGGTDYPTCTAPGVGGGACGGAGQPACHVTLDGPTNYDPLNGATWDGAAFAVVDGAYNDHVAAVASGAYNAHALNAMTSVQGLFSDWFDPIPFAGCTPYHIDVGMVDYTFDHCPVAEKLSSVLGYALWIYLAVGTFLSLTGGRKEA